MNFLKVGFVVFATMIASSTANAWNCTATCKGYSHSVFATLQYSASGPEYSDFQANCEQVLKGEVTQQSASQCGGVSWVCAKGASSSYAVSGQGETLLAARGAARQSCSGENDPPAVGPCMEVRSYRWYNVDDSSFNCAQ